MHCEVRKGPRAASASAIAGWHDSRVAESGLSGLAAARTARWTLQFGHW